MAERKYFAHSLEGKPKIEWQELSVHLNNVSKLAKELAKQLSSSFDNSDWVELAGMWHDLGKYQPKWQKYLEGQSKKGPNHSTVGAVFAFERFQKYPPHIQSLARILGSLIAGHHAGLPDWEPDFSGGDLVGRLFSDPLNRQLDTSELDEIRDIVEIKESLAKDLPKSAILGINNSKEMSERKEHFHLWIRMLFSCLVDADFLDTENFVQPEKFAKRGKYPSLSNLSVRFDMFMQKKQDDSQKSEINDYRNQILKQCRERASQPAGFFSLTVPTGGGKTLSAMAFALKHALQKENNKKRIIMAIPYTSIIEQTAEVYREVFGSNAILEHHSNIDPDKEDSKDCLATENWDAPIIVTTNVQLFESLLASKTSACRKLHNVANSVIILDEAQMLPSEYLKPIISVLKGLVENFNVTVVLCTATQPALCGKIGSEQAVFDGITNVKEIIKDPNHLATVLKRVRIELPNLLSVIEFSDLVDQLKQYDQVLCVVNTRKDCRDLHSLMPSGTYHLSANMCGEERSELISEIKYKLNNNEQIRVVSTQLIEAGVDIDFPIVYRALAGVDSIAQSAGRCNREGKLNTQGKLGKVVVFQPPKPAPLGLLRKGESTTKEIIQNTNTIDLTPELYSKYFTRFYSSLNNFDRPKFYERLVRDAGEFSFQFRTFSQDVRLIDDKAQRGILVYYEGKNNGSIKLIDQLKRIGPESWLLRKLQRFIVNVPEYLFQKLARDGHIEEIHGYWVQKSSGLYRKGYGLLSDIHEWDDELYIT